MPAMTPDALYPELKILRTNIQVSSSQDIPVDFYFGSTWRGLIGWELQRLICPYPKASDCRQCIINEHCPYFVLFEKKTDLPGLSDAPRGYIFFSPSSLSSGTIDLEITLLGYCCRYFPAVLQALIRAQHKGLGPKRQPFNIDAVSETFPSHTQEFDTEKDILSQVQGPFDLSDWLCHEQDNRSIFGLNILTPLRLRQNGKYLSDINLTFMFLTLARRLGVISSIFQGSEYMNKEQWMELKNYFSPLDALPVISKESIGKSEGIFREVKWDDYARFSNRQRKKVPMGGLVGTCRFSTDIIGLNKWLKCAELLHIGKGAAMGLGRVEQIH